MNTYIFWGMARTIIEVPNGPTYRFNKPLDVAFFKSADGYGCVAPQLGGFVCGHGELLNEAFDNWAWEVHSVVQHLISLRPFQMSDAERHQWRKLSCVVDVKKYLDEKPYEHVEHGCVCRRTGSKIFFMWCGSDNLDGQEDVVDASVHRVPDALAGIALFHHVRVLLKRDSATNDIFEVLSVECCACSIEAHLASVPCRARTCLVWLKDEA